MAPLFPSGSSSTPGAPPGELEGDARWSERPVNALVTYMPCMNRGEAGYLRMKREPWRKSGLPYWKGIYSASYPMGKMKSTATLKPMIDCSNSNSNAALISVTANTTRMTATLQFSGVVLNSSLTAADYYQEVTDALVLVLVTKAFNPWITDLRVLGGPVDIPDLPLSPAMPSPPPPDPGAASAASP